MVSALLFFILPCQGNVQTQTNNNPKPVEEKYRWDEQTENPP